jgi:T5orf172 domain
MSHTSSLPLTPRRKWAASGTNRGFRDIVITSETSPNTQSTPDEQEVPDLDWDDTPRSNDSFRTPSSINTLSSKFTADGQVLNTPSRLPKKQRYFERAKSSGTSQAILYVSAESESFELESSDQKSALLFPKSLYPNVVTIKDEISGTFDLFERNFGLGSFYFSKVSRLADAKNIKSSTTSEASALPSPHDTPKKQVSSPKKSTQPPSAANHIVKGDQNAKAATKGALAEDAVGPESQTTIKSEANLEAKVVHKSHNVRDKVTQLALAGVSIQLFMRILPFDTLDRIFEEPGRCAASFVDRPNVRCYKKTNSLKNIKAWLLNHLANHAVQANVFAAENYLRELVDSATCTAFQHRKIAVQQLNRLLDQVKESRCQKLATTRQKFAFNSKDEIAIPYWLEALMKLPDSHKNESIGLSCGAYASASSLKVVATGAAKSNLAPEEKIQKIESCQIQVQGHQRVETIDTAAAKHSIETGRTTDTESSQATVQECQLVDTTDNVTATHSVETTKITHIADTATETAQTCVISKSIEVTQTHDRAHVNQSAQKEEIPQSVTETQSVAMTQTTQRKDWSRQTAESLESSTTRVARTQATTKYPNFNSTLFLGVSFFKASSTYSATETSKSGNQKRTAVREETEIRTRYQKFSTYRPAGSRNISTKSWLHNRLTRPLTKQESDTKLTKGKLPIHQGIIYMYWLTGQFGFVKIGKTSGESTSTRLEDWRNKCGYPVEEHIRGEAEDVVTLPHVYRVEALVHAELNNLRLKETECKKCSETKTTRERNKLKKMGLPVDNQKVWHVGHNEWFQVSPDHAKKVIKKWSDWILTKPYELRGGAWLLRRDITDDEIDALCTPLEIDLNYKMPIPRLRQHSLPGTSTKWKEVKGRGVDS